MAIRKNKKRIDPRYFLHETTYRDLDEVEQAYQSQHAAGWPGEWSELVKTATVLLQKLGSVGAGTGVDISGGQLIHEPQKAAEIPASLDAEAPNLFAQVQEFLPKLIELSKTPMGPHKQLSPALQAAASALRRALAIAIEWHETLKKLTVPNELGAKELTRNASRKEDFFQRELARVSDLFGKEEARDWQQGSPR